MGHDRQHQNRLIHEKSPYLLQHAANPVDWYAWGPEAFAKAAEENKPILLSIGYSSCHWCHVMAHESFENEEIARMMNECFVCVKVDREERPDIDHIYMTAVTAMTGQGGWPLTVFLTPERKPFFGGTYFPPYSKWGMPGLADIIGSIHAAWENNPQQLLQSGANLASMLRTHSLKLHPGRVFEKDILAKGFQQFATLYDSQYAGFGTAPKFPSSHNLSFLLRYWKRAQEPKALSMVEETLTRMAEGGIYDHLGGGFHRYATDQKWQIPHFEKMLYDQAVTLKTYLEAYQINKKELYARIARETCDYVLNDMQYGEGGFYSAQDADSFDPQDYEKNPCGLHDGDKKEGAYYLWRHEEIENVLEKDEAAVFNFYYGVNPQGNAESDPHGEFTGKNILHVARSLEETAAHFKKSEEEIKTALERARKKLLEYRRKRPASFLDDKILTDWNGLMISSLAFGARVLSEPRYLTAAQKAADFILKKLHKNGELLHRYRDGEAAMPGTLSDYAFFIQGLLDLYEATFEPAYLRNAKDLAERMINLFWDPDGGFYFTAENGEELLFRPKEIYDGAIPSGNSVAALDLIRLYHILLEESLREKYEKLFETFSAEVSQNPAAYGQMLIAVDFAWGSSQIVLAGKKEDHLLQTMTRKIYEYFIPNKVVVHNPDHSKMSISDLSPFVAGQSAINGKPTAYICLNHTCQQPVYELEKLNERLKQL